MLYEVNGKLYYVRILFKKQISNVGIFQQKNSFDAEQMVLDKSSYRFIL